MGHEIYEHVYFSQVIKSKITLREMYISDFKHNKIQYSIAFRVTSLI